jgi:membrane-bound lytic murein transglycosylase
MQRRYMSRMMRLSHFPGTTVREYMNRIVEMNAYLQYFPPFGPDNTHHAFTDDELLDIGEFTIPRSMQDKLVEHGFDITAEGTTIDSFVAMCERYEATKTEQDVTESKQKSTSSRLKRKSHPEAEAKWCEIHQSKTHNTMDCYEVKRLKASKTQDAGRKSTMGKPKPILAGRTDKETINTLVEMVKRLKKESVAGKKRKAAADAEVKQMDEQFETLSVSDDDNDKDDAGSTDNSRESSEASACSEHS